MSKVETRVVVSNLGMVRADRLREGESVIYKGQVVTLRSARFRGERNQFVQLRFVAFEQRDRGHVEETEFGFIVVRREAEFPCVNVVAV